MTKKKLRGEDDHKVFSIRLLKKDCAELQRYADEDDVSRNKLINTILQKYIEIRRK
jgi:metal-responsive CopG/Arc/MetJ family transcriptional regulator